MTADPRRTMVIVGAPRDGDHRLAYVARQTRGLNVVLVESGAYVTIHETKLRKAAYHKIISVAGSPARTEALCAAVQANIQPEDVRTVVAGTELYVAATEEMMKRLEIGPPGRKPIRDPSKLGAREAIVRHGAEKFLPRWTQVAESVPHENTMPRARPGRVRDIHDLPSARSKTGRWIYETAMRIAMFAWTDGVPLHKRTKNIDLDRRFPNPVVVKGDSGGDGRGVFLVSNFHDALLTANALTRLVQFDGALLTGVFVDRYVAGRHVSFQGVVDREGRAHPITFTHKHRLLLRAEGVVPFELQEEQPARLAGFRDDLYIVRDGLDVPRQMLNATQRIVNAVGYTNGAIQLDFILGHRSTGGVRFEEHQLEPSFRGRPRDPDLGFRYSGHNLLEAGDTLLGDAGDQFPATTMWLQALLGEDVTRPHTCGNTQGCIAMLDVSNDAEREIAVAALQRYGVVDPRVDERRVDNSSGSKAISSDPLLDPDVEHASRVAATISFGGPVKTVYDAANGVLTALNLHRSGQRGLPSRPSPPRTVRAPALLDATRGNGADVNGAKVNGHRINGSVRNPEADELSSPAMASGGRGLDRLI